MGDRVNPRIVFATGNSHKVAELEAILASVWPAFTPGLVVPMSAFDVSEPVENGVSFEHNSLIKARHVCAETGFPAIADDSGITVDIMGGAPGIFSARWSGTHGQDRENVELLLAQLRDVPQEHRGGAFVSAAALVLPDGREFIERGTVRGTVLCERRGSGGFGYDPIFMPEGWDISTAEMSAEQKNAISHRAAAFQALLPHIIHAFED